MKFVSSLFIVLFWFEQFLDYSSFALCLNKRKVKVSHSLKAVGAVRSRGPIYFLTQWMKGKAHPSSFLASSFPDLKKIPIYCWVYILPYFFGYKTEFFPSKTIPKV